MKLDVVSVLWMLGSVLVTVVLHSAGTVAIVAERPSMFKFASQHAKVVLGQFVIVVVTIELLALHMIEIGFWGVCLRALGFFPDLKASIYFAGISYSSLGYSGALPRERLGLSEVVIATVGLLMFGWSVGILLTTVVQYERLALGFNPAADLPWNTGKTALSELSAAQAGDHR